jgi:hypothetical protein
MDREGLIMRDFEEATVIQAHWRLAADRDFLPLSQESCHQVPLLCRSPVPLL